MSDGLEDRPHGRAYALDSARQQPLGRGIKRKTPKKRDVFSNLATDKESVQSPSEARFVVVEARKHEEDASRLIHAPACGIETGSELSASCELLLGKSKIGLAELARSKTDRSTEDWRRLSVRYPRELVIEPHEPHLGKPRR